MCEESTLAFYKWYFQNTYYLRMQSIQFLICVNKKTGEYENIYATDTESGRKYLSELAESMEKHPNLTKEEDDK